MIWWPNLKSITQTYNLSLISDLYLLFYLYSISLCQHHLIRSPTYFLVPVAHIDHLQTNFFQMVIEVQEKSQKPWKKPLLNATRYWQKAWPASQNQTWVLDVRTSFNYLASRNCNIAKKKIQIRCGCVICQKDKLCFRPLKMIGKSIAMLPQRVLCRKCQLQQKNRKLW